jgi:hypothetical protein
MTMIESDTGRTQLSGPKVQDHIDAVVAGYADAISDAAAVTIAAWYQVPAGYGAVFATLASTGRVDSGELTAAIHATRSSDPTTMRDMIALDGWLKAKLAWR